MKTTDPSRPQVRLKNALLPVLVGGSFFLYLLDGFRGWLALFILFGFVSVSSFLWARSLALGLSLTRKRHFGWIQVGDLLEERLEIQNRGWARAVWVEVAYDSDMPGFQPSIVAGLGGLDAAWTWTSDGVCTQRGLYTLGPVRMRTGDPFGFFEVIREDPQRVSFLVMPPIIPLPGIQVAPGGRVGEARPRPRSLENAAIAAGVREYVPGDSLRHIHWPTTARRSSFYVRRLDNAPASDWWLFVDLDHTVHWGSGRLASDENAVTLTASLADRGLRQGHGVGLGAFGDALTWLPPRHGETHRQDLLKNLALVRRGSVSLASLLNLARPLAGQNPSLIVITPSKDPTWVDILIGLTGLGVVPTVLLMVGPDSQNGAGTDGRRHPLTGALAEHAIAYRLIGPDVFDRPELRPLRLRRWGFDRAPADRAGPSQTMRTRPR